MNNRVCDYAVKELIVMARDLRVRFDESFFTKCMQDVPFTHPWDRDLFVAHKVVEALKLRLHVVLQTKTHLFLCIQKKYPRVPKDVRKLICSFVSSSNQESPQ